MATSLAHATANGPIDPYSTDETALASVSIAGTDIDYISQYAYDSDVLQLGDPFSVVIPDPHGNYGFIVEGQAIQFSIASPNVGNGQKIQKVTGVVTQVMRNVTREGGTVLNVAGADLGWFLVECDAPIWKRLEGRTFQDLYNTFVDPTWGFAGFRAGNDQNVKLKMGGNYTRSIAQLQPTSVPPIIQTEPGDKPADYFIQYAKLANRLVNVSSDGYLQLFQPAQVLSALIPNSSAYTFYNRRDPQQAGQNNVESARLTRTLATRYTKAICVGTRIIPLTQQLTDPNDPNTNSFRGTYTRPLGVLSTQVQAPLPFARMTAFADADRLNKAQASARAKWKIARGDFDAFVYEIEVKGHSQNGNFYEPDTICEVYDDYCGLNGAYYVSAVRYSRDDSRGTRTTLTIRLPNLLGA